jgi:hypothetical protein
LRSPEGIPEKQILEQNFTTKHDVHQPNTPAKGGRKRIQYIHSRRDPFCETVVTILRLAEHGYLFSKDSEDGLGGIAGLKAGKERMGGKVSLRLTLVGFQGGVENRHKVGMRGRCGGDGGHDGSWRRETKGEYKRVIGK